MCNLSEELVRFGADQGREEGFIIGRQQGAKAKSIEIYRTMRKRGIQKAFLLETTGLTEKDVEEIESNIATA